jgi:dipeptidyl aminopeptidase/acylaminoacyl peptidase
MPLFSSRSRPAATLIAAGLLVLLCLPSGVSGAPSQPAAKRRITETDLFQFVWVADPRISPDGRQIVFVRVSVDKKKEGYDTALWIVPTDGSQPPRPFTAGPRDSAPRWSPDGRQVAFVRVPEKEGDGPTDAQLWLIAMGGGEAVQLTEIPEGASPAVWSPDGKTIAFVAGANEKDLAKWEKKKGAEKDKDKAKSEEKKAEEERESDVRVISRAIYRANGAGYLDFDRPGHLWTVPVPASPGNGPRPAARQLTRGEFEENEPTWSPDGALLYFVTTRVKEDYYESPDSDIWSVPAAGGEPRKVVDIKGPIGNIALSRDGKRIAFVGFLVNDPVRSYDQADLFVAEPGGAARNLTADFDFDIGGGISGDQHAPRANRSGLLVWSADGRSLVTVTQERGRANLRRFDAATGKAQPVTEGDQEVTGYSVTPDGAHFALVISNPLSIGDLHVFDAATGVAPRRLTGFDDELFAQLDLTAPEEIEYASFDGKKIQAWVQKPPDFDPKKKYPLILNIHGGPHAAYGYTFDHEFQWMAAKGYVVLYPNPRGSSAYGQEFGNVIQYHYPGDDMKDLLAGVDELVRRGMVDPQKLGITGGSGGGILTNWTITQTDRFAAAVSQRSISDWSSFWYTADFSQFQPTWFRGAPWEDPKDYAARSPITFIDKVKTPLMLIEGEADYRTPPTAGGEQMFRALKYLKRPVVMIRFPGESHELSRSGKPWHRVERLQHIVAWFDKYLQGQKIDIYDVP